MSTGNKPRNVRRPYLVESDLDLDAAGDATRHTDLPARSDADALDEVATPSEVAALLKVPERTLADWRYQDKGPPFHRVGRHVRYLGDEVRAWLRCQ